MESCKCCLSPHRDLIESLLAKNISTRQISKQLKEKIDVQISHACIARHRHHYLARLRSVNDPLSFLDDVGRTRLKRAIYKSMKLYRKLHYCKCPYPTSFRRRGVLYICNTCGGWYPANVAMKIMKENRKKKKWEEEQLVITLQPKRRRL